MTSNIVRRLQVVRKCHGLSQQKLGDLAGYHRNSIERWEHGENQPSIQAVVNIAQALGYELVLRPVTKI